MRKGLPSKFAKMGFKKGWAAFKRSTGGLSGSRKSKSGKKKVHHAVWLDGDMTTPALVSRPVKKLANITPGKVLSPVIDLGLIIVGMMLGAGIKKASPIKNPHLMNAGQTIVGVGGSLMTKNRFVKMPLLGVALQSSISEAKLLFPKMVPLAGDDEVVYLPVGEDDPVQLEYAGDDGRIGEAIGEAPYEVIEGDDDRIGAVMDGDDGEGMDGDAGEAGEI